MFVYFIKSGESENAPIKIGVAGNVDKRLGDLQVGNPEKLTVVAAIKALGEEHAYWIEKSLHKFFKSNNIRGEWFSRINMAKAAKICDTKPIHVPKKKGK